MKSATLSPSTLIMGVMSLLIFVNSGCSLTSKIGQKLSGKPAQSAYAKKEKPLELPSKLKNPAMVKLAYGQWMEERGDYTDARKNYKEAVELQPKNVDALLGLARLDQRNGNYEQAEQGFNRAVKVNPEDPKCLFALGEFYASQERWDESVEVLTRCMLADPDQSDFRYSLAVALVHSGNVDAALPHFIRTIGDAEAYYNVGLILNEMGDLDGAEKNFTLAVNKKPDMIEAQTWLAEVTQLRSKEGVEEIASRKNSSVPAGDKVTPVHLERAQNQGGHEMPDVRAKRL